jgi:hypothetical protein
MSRVLQKNKTELKYFVTNKSYIMNGKQTQVLFKGLFLYLTIALSLLSSCGKDFLNPPVAGVIQRQLYVKDLQTTQEFLGGVYNSLTGITGGIGILYPEAIADNLKPPTGGSQFIAHYNWQQEANELNSNTQNLNLLSINIYSVIVGCNFVIDCATKFKNENETKANVIKGQALSIRALMYFFLVNYFAQSYNFTADASHPGVAINTSFDYLTLPSRRSTVAEVYEFMINDLKEAVPLLPVSMGSSLFVNQNVAKGLLARVYLFKGDYTNARTYSRVVAASYPLMTTNYPVRLFTLQQTDAIFQSDQNLLGQVQLASFFFRTSIQFYATNDIANLLKESPTDSRGVWVTSSANGWLVNKYPQGIIAGIPTPSIAYYHTEIHSSEMYLTAAESYAQLNNVDSARFYLDAVKKRADPMAGSTILSGAALLEAIYKERRKELAFEGFRMFDLLRWKKGVTRTDALTGTPKELPYPSNKGIAPVPDIDVKLNGFSQNADY